MAEDDRTVDGGRAGGPLWADPFGGEERGAPPSGREDQVGREERLVRELMRRAVADVSPAPGGLQQIRRAVPRRRAVRRGAWTGAAAVAVTVSFLLPALHTADHLGLSGGPGLADAESGSASATTAGPLPGNGTGGPSRPPVLDAGTPVVPGSPSGTVDSPPTGGATTALPGPGTFAPSTATSTGGDDAPILALCTRGDLGQGTAQIGAADARGRIYGSFTLTNVSGRTCRLGGPGSVTVTGTTGTESDRIRIAFHTAGDPATGLPAPGPSAGPATGSDAGSDGLVLAPRAVYRVDIAWIPDQGGCPAPGGSPSPSASIGSGQPGGSGGGTTGGGATGTGGTGAGAGDGGATGGPGTGGAGALPGASDGGGGSTGGPSDASTGGSGAGAGTGALAATSGQPGGPGTSSAGTTRGPGTAALAGSTGAPSTTTKPATATTTGTTGAPSPSATPAPGPSRPAASVTLAYTPAPGNPAAASVVLTGACSGTVYRTAPRPVAPDGPAGAPSAAPSSEG
ncbi:hypothetical protein ACFP3U_19200 [Kitasatospora misakiensis]|uniref:DUF4232 domain-containing protein n=1 Tax=Kitasatospora misakiensis TaxID=67330 RepID=A0ABW0X7M4_9ACTN